MASGVNIRVEVRGMQRMRAILTRLTGKMRTRTDLHARWAILTLNWIDRNFRTEGGMVGDWKPLSPNTLAARRKGSGLILQNTGQLRMSFVPRWTSEQATVGSAMQIAQYHEKGTKPYTIEPVNTKFLRFKMATEFGIRIKKLASGKVISLPFAKGDYVYAKLVHHPGLPARRMLPRANEPTLMVDLLKAALNYVKQRENE